MMKKPKNILILLSLPLLSIFVHSCKKDDSDPENPQTSQNDEEVITTLQITFTDTNSPGSTQTFIFRDPDGPGGQTPDIFDTIRLNALTTYQASILLLNETTQPIDTISQEVEEEAAEHILCFVSDVSDLTITRTDSDGQFELGLESLWTSGNPAEGQVRISLKHQPGIKDGTCDPGETDIEIDFPLVIE